MSDTIKDFNEQVDIKVKKELEKKEFDKKLDIIIKSSEIYPDIIKSLSGLRKSVEVLNKSIEKVEVRQDEHQEITVDRTKDIKNIYEKMREILESLTSLENQLMNKNNSNSLIEFITKKFNEQNKKMTDKNNNNSIVSILNKNGKIQAWITWGLITIVTVLGIIDKLFTGV